MDDGDNAFKLALDAAVTDPKIRPLSKINLYNLLMNLLLDNGYEKEAKKLADLKDEIIFVANQPVDKGDKESLDYKKELEEEVKSMEESLMPTWRKILREI